MGKIGLPYIKWTSLLLFVQLWIFSTNGLKNGFTIRVDAGEKECFYEDITTTNVTLDIEFQVSGNSDLKS